MSVVTTRDWLLVVVLLAQRLHLEARIALERRLEGREVVRRAQPHGHRLEDRRRPLVEAVERRRRRPRSRSRRRCPAVEDAHDRPGARRRAARVRPGRAPGRRRARSLPTTISYRPGVRKRPSTHLHVVAHREHARRDAAHLHVGVASVPRTGSAAITTTSALTSGPSAPRATCGASSTIRTSSSVDRARHLGVRARRCTIAFCGWPDETSVALKPRASASIATNTPTVPAIPSTATTEEVQRSFDAPQVVDEGDRHAQSLRSASTTAGASR